MHTILCIYIWGFHGDNLERNPVRSEVGNLGPKKIPDFEIFVIYFVPEILLLFYFLAFIHSFGDLAYIYRSPATPGILLDHGETRTTRTH